MGSRQRAQTGGIGTCSHDGHVSAPAAQVMHTDVKSNLIRSTHQVLHHHMRPLFSESTVLVA